MKMIKANRLKPGMVVAGHQFYGDDIMSRIVSVEIKEDRYGTYAAVTLERESFSHPRDVTEMITVL